MTPVPAAIEAVASVYPEVREIEIPTTISDLVTLSTMHGCPPDEIERITRFDPLTGDTITVLERAAVYPASHYVTRRRTLEQMVPLIREELAGQVERFQREGRLLEAQGRDVIFPQEQSCCGQPAYNTGYHREAARAARRFIEKQQKQERIK